MTKPPRSNDERELESKICFVMMPISDVDGYPSGHFGEVYSQLIFPAVEAAGYRCELATSTNSAHMIQLDVVTKVATADLCICDLSTNNANVLFEYGIRQAFDRPTVLIKDNLTRRLFDLSGFRDIEYDHTLRIATTLKTRELITKAISDTVEGSGDNHQVFSLVTLMKLTRAALPSGEINRDDARFALLEQKLDNLLRSVAPPNSLGVGHYTFDDPDLSPRHHARVGEYVVYLSPKLLKVVHPDNLLSVYDNSAALERSPFWQSLNLADQGAVLRLMKDKGTELRVF